MESINPTFTFKKKQKKGNSAFIKAIAQGNKYILSELITLLESEDESKKAQGLEIISSLSKKNTDKVSRRVGITGPPGVGKSTFINVYARYLSDRGHRVAVLAVDPSSLPTKGSILGDKTRMSNLNTIPNVYVRPSPAGDMLGGVAKGTREAIEACELAGYDIILVETVGIGQSEHLASQMVDITVLLLQVGAGDDIQGIKRGIIEMADIFVVNKDDGEHKPLVSQALSYYRQALSFIQSPYDFKYNKVLSCSSLEGDGFDMVEQSVKSLFEYLYQNKLLVEKRKLQDQKWLATMMKEYINDKVKRIPAVREVINDINKSKDQKILSQFELFKQKFNAIISKL